MQEWNEPWKFFFFIRVSSLSPPLFLPFFFVYSTGTISATKTGMGIKKKSSREGKASFGYRVASLFGWYDNASEEERPRENSNLSGNNARVSSRSGSSRLVWSKDWMGGTKRRENRRDEEEHQTVGWEKKGERSLPAYRNISFRGTIWEKWIVS